MERTREEDMLRGAQGVPGRCRRVPTTLEFNNFDSGIVVQRGSLSVT